MPHMPDEPDLASDLRALADELGYISSNPKLFTKADMAAMMKVAEKVIRAMHAAVEKGENGGGVKADTEGSA